MGGRHGTWHVLHEGCKESPACYYAAMTGSIGLKRGMQVGTHKITRVRVSMVECYSTCARACPLSIYRERLHRLRSNCEYC